MGFAVDASAALDAQRAKLLALFCALGLAMFMLDLGAGIWLWHYMGQYQPTLPRFDSLLADLRSADTAALVDIAMKTREGWAACEEARGGTIETLVHIAMAASFIGLALFGLCFILALLLHNNLSRQPGGQSEPLAPDDVDDTWK
ncbi:MAG: hypothetical protein ABI648_01855 [Betaproteobacteria bacterium]